ncbi:MAG: UDP-N-acetylmuramate--L-alanine ligase, partial [Bdellovibrionales bacterium]
MSIFKLKAQVSISSPTSFDLELDLKDSIYFMGICGAAMASFASYLNQIGFQVSGSDKNIYPPMSSLLEKNKIPVFNYSSKNLSSKIKLVIIGNVIQKKQEEIQALEDLKIPYISLPHFLNQTILNKTKNIVIAGTHGKSTTSSLMAKAAQSIEKESGFFIAALSENFKNSFYYSHKTWFVIEGDEYDTSFFEKKPKFFYYNPFGLILTSIEFDHADIYKNFDEVKAVFKQLIEKLKSHHYLVACFEDPTVEQLSRFSKSKIISYGLTKGDYQIKNRQLLKNQQKFDIHYKNQSIGTCVLNLLGRHNALNALAVIACSHALKWPLEKVLQALNAFKGLERRLQKIGEYNNDIWLYEDFAHH